MVVEDLSDWSISLVNMGAPGILRMEPLLVYQVSDSAAWGYTFQTKLKLYIFWKVYVLSWRSL